METLNNVIEVRKNGDRYVVEFSGGDIHTCSASCVDNIARQVNIDPDDVAPIVARIQSAGNTYTQPNSCYRFSNKVLERALPGIISVVCDEDVLLSYLEDMVLEDMKQIIYSSNPARKMLEYVS